MTFRLIEGGWEDEFKAALRDDASELRIICPFIQEKPIRMLLDHQPRHLQVITRFKLGDYVEGVSDLAALRRLLEADARVRGVRHLHAKLYVFGKTRAIITSCNLTEAALNRNHELGVVTTDGPFIQECLTKFDEMWNDAGKDLELAQAEEWELTVKKRLQESDPLSANESLGDLGAVIRSPEAPPLLLPLPSEAFIDQQAFVKFLGSDANRFDLSDSTRKVIEWEGCHRAVCYPTPSRMVNDHDIIFMGRLTRNPNDILIFGQAIGMAYEEGRDDASEADIGKQDWRGKYSHYIRLHHPEFIEGKIGDGVSLYELMDELKADSFASTKQHKELGSGNMNPRRAYNQKPQVKLSTEGYLWIHYRLQEAFNKHGKVSDEVLESIDWPYVSGNSTLQT